MVRRDVGRKGMLAAALVAFVLLAAGIAWMLWPTRSDPHGIGIRADGAAADGPPASAGPSRSRGDRMPSSPISPRPFAESEPIDVAASRPGALVIEVIGPAGAPAPRARLVLHRAEAVLGTATTDVHGIAAFRSGEGEAALLVVPDGAPIHATTIPIAAGRRRVELPAGVSIAGRVEVTGEAPSEPVALRMFGDDGQIAMQVWSALRGETSSTCTTDAAGRFEHAGLLGGSKWRFGPTVGFRVDEILWDGLAVFEIAAPASGVVVKLARLPVIRGRVVSEDRRVPLAGATCEVGWRGPVTSMSRILQVEDDGTFRFSAASQDPAARFTSIEVTVRGPGRVGERRVVLDPPPARDHDLGDLAIAAGRPLRFVVRDPTGAPIEGAFACAGPEGPLSSRTDALGLGAITLGKGAGALRVGALRYEVTEVPIPDPAPEVLAVTLKATCGLEVAVVAPVGGFTVKIRTSSEDLFSGSRFGDRIHIAGGASEVSYGGGDDRGFSAGYQCRAGFPVVIAGLQAGVSIEIAAIDGLGREHDTTSLTLAPGEWRKVDLRVTQRSRSVRGIVRGPDGKALAGAQVEIAAERDAGAAREVYDGEEVAIVDDRPSLYTSTGADGRFVVSGIFESIVTVAASEDGFAPCVRRGVALRSDETEVDLTLEKGYVLTVKVVDANGAPIPNLDVTAEIDGEPAPWAVFGPGLHAFRNLPANVTVVVKTRWAEREWTQAVVVNGDETTQMTMPPMGTVVVDWSVVGRPPYLVRLKPVASNDDMPGLVNDGLSPSREVTIYPVFPGDYIGSFLAPDGSQKDGFAAAREERVTVRPGETTRVVLRKP